MSWVTSVSVGGRPSGMVSKRKSGRPSREWGPPVLSKRLWLYSVFTKVMWKPLECRSFDSFSMGLMWPCAGYGMHTACGFSVISIEPIYLSLSLSLSLSYTRSYTMVRISNNLVGILNFVTFLLSIPILGGGIWLARQSSTECEKFLQGPVIALGVFLMIVSLAGLVGACCRVSWLLWFYLLVMFVLIVLLFCFTIFAFAVTNKGAGEVVSNRGYKEYRLGDYSHWLQKRVSGTKNWNKIKSCLIDGKVCKSLIDDGANNNTLQQFYQKNLSPIQSGCCKPPDDCNFAYVTATNWTTTSNSSSLADSDCGLWSNDPSVLCFNCGSCKAGVLQNIKHDWKKVAIVNIIFLVFLVIVYSIGCCAFRNNREDNSYNKYPRRYP